MKIMGLGPVTFFVLMLVVTSLFFNASSETFGTTNFFDKHSYFFLVAITFFPRLTLLFSSVASGGLIWWLGFFFTPRVLVATLATVAYYKTNPYLVMTSWVVAIGGEFMEKKKLSSNQRFVFKSYRNMGRPQAGPSFEPEPEPQVIDKSGAIEAEFTKK